MAGQGSTKSIDAFATRRTQPDAADLPSPTPDLFITAGAIAAERAARGAASRGQVEEILRRAVDQAATLREVAA